MFFDDSKARFLGYQDGNLFIITGYDNGDNISGAEMIFTNFPPQLSGEDVWYYNAAQPEKGEYPMTVRLINQSYNYKLDKYTNVKDRHSLWSISDQILKRSEIRSFKQGVKYKITLRWFEYTADYYVTFENDPAQFKF